MNTRSSPSGVPLKAPQKPRAAEIPAWLVFGTALVFEYLALGYLVDAKDVLAPAGLEHALTHIGELAPLAFVALASVFVTGGSALRLRLRALSAYRPQKTWTLVWGVANVLLFAGVLGLAQKLRAFDGDSIAIAQAWLAVFGTAALGTVCTLVFALWSPTMLLQAIRGLRRELVVGCLVGVVAWIAGLLARLFWKPLAWLSLDLVHALLTLIASDPVASTESALVGTSRFYVEVAPVCSGIEGVGLMLTFVGAHLYIQRRELIWPRSLVLLPLSAVLVWLLNVVRITSLIAVGTWYSPEVALGGFHSKAGWVLFALTALGTVLVVHRAQWFRLLETGPPAEGLDPSPDTQGAREGDAQGTVLTSTASGAENEAEATSAYLAPLLAVLAAKLVTGLAIGGFDYLYPLSVVAAILALWFYRRHYPHPQWRAPWLASAAGTAVAVVWIAGFERGGSPSTLAAGLTALPGPLAVLWLTSRAVGTIVTVPIVEELAFRGYLLRRFVAADFDKVPYERFSWLGLIVSSVTFGLLHSQVALGVASGLVFGLLTILRGRISDAVVAHSVANALIFAYAVFSGDWALLG